MRGIRGQMSESLLIGALLAVAGGYFDAYSYLCRGGVFANAQTGNIVLLGIEFAKGEWSGMPGYLTSILAFAFGVIVSEIIKNRYKSQERNLNIHWRQIIVLAEIALIASVSCLSQDWNRLVNLVISFVCALQVESFRKVEGSAFATTMCTGNLRSGTEQLVKWIRTKDETAKKKVRNYYLIILFFICGAVLGTHATAVWQERALLLSCIPLLMVFGIMFISEEKETLQDAKNAAK